MPINPRRPDLVFEYALSNFLECEGYSLLDDPSERNTCGRLAIYLQQQLQKYGYEGYYADVEYNRKQNGQVKTIINDKEEIVQITSDLIAHTRGRLPPPYDNLIAIEAKKIVRPEEEKEADRIRLQAMTKMPLDDVWPWDGSFPEHVCGYVVGIYIIIDIIQRQLHLEFYEKGNLIKVKLLKF